MKSEDINEFEPDHECEPVDVDADEGAIECNDEGVPKSLVLLNDLFQKADDDYGATQAPATQSVWDMLVPVAKVPHQYLHAPHTGYSVIMHVFAYCLEWGSNCTLGET